MNSAASASPTSHAETRWVSRVVLFLSGQTVSLLGSALVQYAVFWYPTIEYKSGWIMALAAVFGFLPQAIVSVFGGVWADRHNRKYLIIAADASIAAATVVLAILMMTGYTEVWLLFAVMAIRSAGAGVQMPAVSALIPQLVPTAQLLRINGINGTIQSAMALLAPAAGGAIFAWSTAYYDGSAAALIPIFFIDIVTAVIGIGLVSLIRVGAVRTAGAETPGYFADLVDGVKYIATHKFVKWLMLLFAIIFVLTVAPSNLTPLMAVRSFDAGETQNVVNLAVLEVMFSVGMMLGGALIATLFAKRSRVALIIVASLLFGALSIGLGLSPNIWVFFGFMFLTGLAVPFFSTPSMTLLQESVEPERQGRVFGFVGIVMALAMPLGMVLFGPLADIMPIETLLIGAGILTFVVVALAVWLPSGQRAIAAAREIQARSAQAAAEHPGEPAAEAVGDHATAPDAAAATAPDAAAERPAPSPADGSGR